MSWLMENDASQPASLLLIQAFCSESYESDQPRPMAASPREPAAIRCELLKSKRSEFMHA
jgi:hypothetical protein